MSTKEFSRLLYLIFSVMTAMIGYQIHHSIGWSIMDFMFTPITWVKWLVCHEINVTIINQTFDFFFH